MGMMIDITDGQSVRLTDVNNQPLYLARDAGAFDLLDLELIAIPVGGSATLVFNLYHGMQMQTEDGWQNIAFPTLTSISSESAATLSLKGGFMRYMRWSLTTFTGTATAVGFTMRAMARTFKEARIPRMVAGR